MQYLITGSRGQVGSAVADRTADSIGINRTGGEFAVDITTPEIGDVIAETRPDAIVHTAAFHRMDEAETTPERSHEVNVGGTRRILDAAEAVGAHVIFISTDNVFDGERGYYSEDDNTNPVNVYSQHKLEAEKNVVDADTPATVLRSALIFAGGHDNFFTWIREQLTEDGTVGAVTDQVCNPTYAGDLADIIVEAAERGITGTFHAAGASIVTRYEAACLFQHEFGVTGEITKTTRKELPWDATRPRNTSLSLSKLVDTFETEPQSLAAALSTAFE